MKKWSIEYWSGSTGKKSIEHWLEQRTKEELKSLTKELAMLELTGNQLRMPHSKALGEGLFELRERRYGFRIYYGFHGNNVIILLAAGDKKSQTNDIRLARERLLKV